MAPHLPTLSPGRVLARAIARVLRRPPSGGRAHTERILDLLEEYVYAGEMLPDGDFIDLYSGPGLDRLMGGPLPDGLTPTAAWDRLVHPDDWQIYEDFSARQARGELAEAEYRIRGYDGVTRWVWDRARPRLEGGRILVDGIISDITAHRVAVAELAEANGAFTDLLEVVGEHVYRAHLLPDGSYHETFQGPGADRLLGGAFPDPDMANWEAAIHPEDRPHYDGFTNALLRGEDVEVEYRLIGADGVTRWVHDRCRVRLRPDGVREVSGIVADVTMRRQLREELADAHAKLSRVVAAVDEHLYTYRVEPDGSYEVVYSGPNRARLLGADVSPHRSGPLWDSLIHPDDLPAWERVTEHFVRGEPVDVEYRLLGLDGRTRVVWDRLRPRREDGVLYYDGIVSDITERKRLETELAELAHTDPLTGTRNRRHLTDSLDAALEGEDAPIGVLLLDLDHFKHINDTYGHRVGDEVLVEVAARLRRELRAGDTLARWGGEEFAVLVPGVRDEAALAAIGDALRAAVGAAPLRIDGIDIPVTLSVGAARGAAGGSADPLFDAADRALYAAKRRGRDRVCLASDTRLDDAGPDEPEAVRVARAFAYAAGAREGVPESHAEEVARLAGATAERLGLPAVSVLRCRLAAWLHDVGKVAISESILLKPGPLDAAEWEIMRTHAAIGEEIARRVEWLQAAAAAVRHHHERWDGGGYPDGLAGEEIPLEARIVAAADAYSAITASRPYASARTPGQAVAELRRSAGTHLDAEVVAALVAVLAEQLGGELAAAA